MAYVRTRTGHDFTQYKRATVVRRIARRAQVTRNETLGQYYNYLRENVEEAQALFADFLISVTTFFRDPDAFAALNRQVIPQLVENAGVEGSVRVWVPGCATGEEAYTIGILLLEETARHDPRPDIQVFGSDLDVGALAIARDGRYPNNIENVLDEERLRRYFTREGDHYVVRRELRDIVLFASHSLLKDPPFSRVDLVSCRNLLIYLDRDLQAQVCSTLHYALNPKGFLFLGSSESADQPNGLFRVLDREARIFQSIQQSPDRRTAPPALMAGHFSRGGPSLHPRANLSPNTVVDAAVHRRCWKGSRRRASSSTKRIAPSISAKTPGVSCNHPRVR